MAKLHSGYRLKFPKFILNEGFNLISGQHLSVEIVGSDENEIPVELIIIALDNDTVELHVKELLQDIKEDKEMPCNLPQNIEIKPIQKTENPTSVDETADVEKHITSITDEEEDGNQYDIPNPPISQDNIGKRKIVFTETCQLEEARNIVKTNDDECVKDSTKVEIIEKPANINKSDAVMICDELSTRSNSTPSTRHHSFKTSADDIINEDDKEIIMSNNIQYDTNKSKYQTQDKNGAMVISTPRSTELNDSECSVLKMNPQDILNDDIDIKKDENGRYSCILCSKKVLNLLTHIQLMHKNIPKYEFLMKLVRKKLKNSNKCEHCLSVFETFYDLSLHIEHAHNLSSDSFGFSGNHEVDNTILSDKKTSEDLICDKCQIMFKSEYLLNRHLKHECGIMYYCDQCSYSCKTSKCLRKHIQLHHASAWTEPYNCEHCCKKLKNIFGLYRHVLKNHKDIPNYQSEINRLKKQQNVKCPKCPLTLQWRNMKQHIISSHISEKTSVKCQECGVILKNVDNLRVHVKNIHETKEKKFPCSKCGNSFRTKQLLSYHMKNVHANPEILYKCEECEYTTSSKKYLKNHCGQKHVPANYMCGECGRCFKTPDKLKRHNLLIHNPEQIERHSCNICNKKFQLKANLNKHVKTVHLKSYTYTCDLCDLGFHSEKLISQHYKRKHESSVAELNEIKDKIEINDHLDDKVIKALPQENAQNLPHTAWQAIPYDGKVTIMKRSMPKITQSNASIRKLLPKFSHDKFNRNIYQVDSPKHHGSLNINRHRKGEQYEQAAPTVENPMVQSLFIQDEEIVYQEQEVATLSETHATKNMTPE